MFSFSERIKITITLNDKTISISFKYKINNLNHKIKLSSRERKTRSPYIWVENLKTFKRYDLSYTIYFKKMLLGNHRW